MRVRQGKRSRDVTGNPGESLLFACYREGLEINYDCRGGSCRQCLVKVEGDSEGLRPPTPKELALIPERYRADYRLACMAFFEK